MAQRSALIKQGISSIINAAPREVCALALIPWSIRARGSVAEGEHGKGGRRVGHELA